MSSPKISDQKRQAKLKKFKTIQDKLEKSGFDSLTEEEIETFNSIYKLDPSPPVKKSGSGCMVALLILIAPTILLSLLIFA